jgi:hypothetical protein
MTTRAERRRVEQKKEQGRICGAFAGVLVALVPSLVPRLPLVIVAVLVVLWLASWRMARDGYKYHLAGKWTVLVMLVHGSVFAGMGYWIWPRITVSPQHVSFQGYPNETFNFSVRNGRADDIYDVQVPFLIGYNKHFEDKLSAKVVPNGDPPQRIHVDYNYCFGEKGDGIVSHVQKNEREVLIVRITHLAPYSSGGFSITYEGGEKFDAKSETPNFIREPYSYSAMQGTFGVRGDYRICKYAVSTDGLVEK